MRGHSKDLKQPLCVWYYLGGTELVEAVSGRVWQLMTYDTKKVGCSPAPSHDHVSGAE